MKMGDTVFTVNADTNKVDKWIFTGEMEMGGRLFMQLSTEKRSCFLPKECVFETHEEAAKIARKNFNLS